ncbi:hypothetical protein GN956_G24626 [Arapaima gigas]
MSGVIYMLCLWLTVVLPVVLSKVFRVSLPELHKARQLYQTHISLQTSILKEEKEGKGPAAFTKSSSS